jgi:hypothetical protein
MAVQFGPQLVLAIERPNSSSRAHWSYLIAQ